jgi:hypothetical protein
MPRLAWTTVFFIHASPRSWDDRCTPLCPAVNGNDAVSDQKISKFFVSHMEESMTGHMAMMEFIKN